MSTFQEIAQYVRAVEPSQRLGGINYCGMIAELAEAMHRLEYNLAFQLAHLNLRNPNINMETRQVLIDTWLGHLRADLPTTELQCPRCGNPAETPQEALMHCDD